MGWIDITARNYDPALGRWMNLDPLAELAYDKTPYHFVSNNPINRIDPDGLTDFTLNKKTGEVAVVEGTETDDGNDRIVKSYQRGKKEGEVKTKKNGESRVAIDDIEKGILEDGQNFKTESNGFAVGGEGQPSKEGVEAFALKLSDYVGTEIGGALFSTDGGKNTTHITLGGYEKNSFKETNSTGVSAFRQFVSTVDEFTSSLIGFFHTHPSAGGISDSDRLVPSGKDRRNRDKALAENPNLKFFILTHPDYGGRFPRKIDYTKGYPASDRR